MKKQTIAVDIDDVLSMCGERFVEFSNQKWGSDLTFNDIVSEDWADIWGIDHLERNERAAIIQTSDFFDEMKPKTEAMKVLDKLKTDYHLILVTSRSCNVDEKTRNWVKKHFSEYFNSINHAGIYDSGHGEDAHEKTKGEILGRLEVDYLIDDQPKHCLAALEIGIKPILYGDYPWNKQQLDPGIHRAFSWEQVGKYFEV